MIGSRVLLVGELVVDVTLQTISAPTKVRIGGVYHAVRGAWACGAQIELAYFSPAYLDSEAENMAKAHGLSRATKIGNILGTPNVMLIAEPTEAGSQGYEHLLSEHSQFTFEEAQFAAFQTDNLDVLIICGNFDVAPILQALSRTSARVHLDVGGGPMQLETLLCFGRPLSTLFLSTSSNCFESIAGNLPDNLNRMAGQIAERVILKENRGGARLVTTKEVIEVGSQRRDIVHSVGVGDVFDVVYTLMNRGAGDEPALSYASWIAAEYASTTFPDDFKRETQRTLKLSSEVITSLSGIRLRWEDRPAHQIYVAAPDFDYADRRPIDRLVDCLRYHNFTARLPIRENGQASDKMTAAQKKALYLKDIELLEQCELLIAVNVFNDPGTLIEIGIAHAKGISVLVYDPENRATNVMLVNAPQLVTDSLDKIVTATFDIIARICAP
jgi:nucleoside 2-deoxyribosyltransferase